MNSILARAKIRHTGRFFLIWGIEGLGNGLLQLDSFIYVVEWQNVFFHTATASKYSIHLKNKKMNERSSTNFSSPSKDFDFFFHCSKTSSGTTLIVGGPKVRRNRTKLKRAHREGKAILRSLCFGAPTSISFLPWAAGMQKFRGVTREKEVAFVFEGNVGKLGNI